MTITEALNEAAKKQGYKNWNEVENKPAYGGSSIRAVACIAAELYAASKAKEAFEAARGIDYNGTNEYYFADYEAYKNSLK